MDPITQGLVGATLAQSGARHARELRLACLAGVIGGMLADADVFIRLSSDPLFAVAMHRHFTHALIFIPLGGLIAAGLSWLALRGRASFWPLARYATLGFATSGLLDACTSYGTHLGWPFSNVRIAWNIIGIVDPVFTVTVFVLVVLSAQRRSIRLARVALAFALLYLAFGWVQRERAYEAQQQLASKREHAMTRRVVKPSPLSLLLWRSMYTTAGTNYIDGIRVGYFGGQRVYVGQGVAEVPVATVAAPPGSALARDLERFYRFSDDWVHVPAGRPAVLADLRYSMLPHALEPLWGIKPQWDAPDRHAPFLHFRNVDAARRAAFWAMLTGRPIVQEE